MIDPYTVPEGRLSTTPEEIRDIPGYMGSIDSVAMPHVVAWDGAVMFPNTFLARVNFLTENLDLHEGRMSESSSVDVRNIHGILFFRFVRKEVKRGF